MSLKACLDLAVRDKVLSKDDALDLAERYDAYRARHAVDGAADADLRAQASLAAELRADAAEAKRRTLLQAKALIRVDRDIASYRTATGKEDILEGAISLIEHYGQGAPYASIEGRRKAITGMAHARMADVIRSFERTWLVGRTPDRARLDNVVREAFGENSGDSVAKGLAAAWAETADWLRQRFNRAGGNIGKLEQWGLPQAHNSVALLKAGKTAWKEAILPLLDPGRMRHPATGVAFSPGDLDAALDTVWDNIVTDGWASRQPQAVPAGRGALAKQHAEHRFLVFRNADAWLSYQRDFGEGDAFAAMMHHLNLMARDVAALEILGPNPNATVAWLGQAAAKEIANKKAGLASRIAGPAPLAETKAHTLDNMWAMVRGGGESPANSKAARFFAGSRNWITASVMGSAIISSVPTDPIYQMIARRMAGLPMASSLRDMLRSAGGYRKHEAVRMGLILDSAMHTFSTQARYVGTLSGPEWTRWLADRTLTLSGLTPWTQGAKHAFGMAFMGELAERAGRRFEALTPRLRETMERYGLTAADWDKMRAAKLHEPEPGATFMRPQEVSAIDESLALRMLEMIHGETEYAVPSGTLRGRAALVRGTKAGTLWGEVARSFAMFKSFPVTFFMLYGARAWREAAASPARGAAYAGAVLLTTTLGGMMAMWVKDLLAGKDPRPIGATWEQRAKFGGAAILQGGGLGIFGDFLFADVNRFGGGLKNTLTGPVVERANSLIDLTAGNLVQLAAGEETDFAEEARRFAQGNVPGSSIWYLKIAYQRMVMDQLEYLADPHANRQFKRRQRDWQKDFGSDMWWRPGQPLPDRLPGGQ